TREKVAAKTAQRADTERWICPKASQIRFEHAQETRPILAGETKGWRQRRLASGEDRSAFHSGPESRTCPAQQNHRSGDHRRARELTAFAFHNNHTAAHEQAEFVACRTANEDASAGQAAPRPAICCSDLIPRRAPHLN